nr:immunoglobulin light chain junction region [Macaca mulatta]MOX29219.1 immunoglobulin light chain junction region [Macaca mulatta]MOX29390.1 immunoglobulin light chain junction region [Macaca mulatta]MOX30005.1 immunoglobulin light chain junction region [Macaca mulatta]MOX30983.1 immunoglobulin light chain junction region [Macaca mulatta]
DYYCQSFHSGNSLLF